MEENKGGNDWWNSAFNAKMLDFAVYFIDLILLHAQDRHRSDRL